MAGTLFIMLACFTWALDTLIRYPLLGAGYSTLQVVLFEHLALVLITAPLIWRYRHHYRQMRRTSLACLFFIGGVGSALGTLAFTEAFHYLNPTVVILLQKLQPVIAIVLAFAVLKEQIRGHFVRWSLVILGGSFLMIAPDIMALGDAQWHYSDVEVEILKGYGFTLLAVAAWGAATVCGKYLSYQSVPANAIMSGRFLSGLLVLLVLSLGNTDQISTMPAEDLGALVVMALLSGLLGMWLYYQGLKTVRAQLATLAELTFPVFAAGINWVFLDMSLTLYQIAGAILLIAGNIGLRLRDAKVTQQDTLTAQGA